MHTRSAVLLFDDATAPGRAFTALSDTERGIVIQRLGVLLRTVAPVFLLCDPRDLGVSERVRDPHFEVPCLYVYDQYPGGIGLSEGFLGNLPQIVRGAQEVVEKCACENGCPSCIGAPDREGAVETPSSATGSAPAVSVNAKSAVKRFLGIWMGSLA